MLSRESRGAAANWLLRSADESLVESLSASVGCPAAVARMLVLRGLGDSAAAQAFLCPQMETLFDAASDPMLMLGMALAVERILAAIRASEPMLIYGDYDVDGTTATVLLKTTIERIALALDASRPATVRYHVPHRIREGYGMRSSVLADAAENGIRLVISVDTGIRAVAEAVEARRLGLDLIVTDHHLPDEMTELPDALAVINPTQPGCPYPNKHLCGAAVAFKVAQALLMAAEPMTSDPAAFAERARGVLLPSFLKLVAIATIADSVPLMGENRVMAAVGLAALARPVQPGLRALMEVAKVPLDRAPTATEVGFRIAPRINAAGRMDIASEVVELFLTRDTDRARELAVKLDVLNAARRESESRALETIEEQLATILGAAEAYPQDCLIFDDPEWHRGVLGILASRVVERTGRPALVVTHADGHAHGSGRSIPGFHLLDAIAAADAADPAIPLFLRFGGHAHAVGFTLPSDQLCLLRERMTAYTASCLDASLLAPQLEYDAELGFEDFTPEFADWVERCAPFGVDNPEPVFFTRNAVLAAPVRLIQEKHVCLRLAERPGGGRAIEALGWSRSGVDWGGCCERLRLAPGATVDLLYRIRRKTGPYANPNFGGLELELRGLRAPG